MHSRVSCLQEIRPVCACFRRFSRTAACRGLRVRTDTALLPLSFLAVMAVSTCAGLRRKWNSIAADTRPWHRPTCSRFGTTVRGRIGGTIVTAPGRADVDYVCRFFDPAVGVDEDPACGSIQCTLAPYWARRLGKQTLRAQQLSARGGSMQCEIAGDRVKIVGKAR